MKIVILNFYDPVEKRLLEWFRENHYQPFKIQTNNWNQLVAFFGEVQPEILFIDLERTYHLKNIIRDLREQFPSLLLIGLTCSFSLFMKKKLLLMGLHEYIDMNRLPEEGMELFQLKKGHHEKMGGIENH